MGSLLIALIECGNPVDVFERRSETKALAKSCRLMGHKTASFQVRSLDELQSTLEYLASAESRLVNRGHGERAPPLVVHLSCHGDEFGLDIGTAFCSWRRLAEHFRPMLSTRYGGRTMLSISSCGSGSNTLASELVWLRKPLAINKFPLYIFSLQGKSLEWDDALIAWTLLYQRLSRTNLDEHLGVMIALQQVLLGTGLRIRYQRWDVVRQAYRRFKTA